MLKIGDSDVLLVIDVQNDFCPGGALAISNADEVVPIINKLAEHFQHIILTQDWHPPGHKSFASAHPGKRVYDSVEAPYGQQTLWPDHCVQGTNGAEFHKDLNVSKAELILRKGFRKSIDSYSAFLENDHVTSTGLAGYLRERGFQRIFLAGLAYDYCVRFSAIDGVKAGFKSFVIEDACRSVNLADSIEATNLDFAKAGIQRITSSLFIECPSTV
ncbi:MAG TPA: bifunctional nicotinamidase/pyrazinamidase [Terriglobales bacterium]|nr:bifunctional nicotinamidase/pyrazinamidase [Terriglobales bacterium]